MALVRVKRRLNEDPIDVLLLTCKKQKTDNTSSSTVFKFAATVNKDEDVDCRIKEVLNAEDQLSQYKKHPVPSYSLTEKLRLDTRSHSKENRLKVINCYRDVDLVSCAISEGDEGLPRTLTVVHIENRPPTLGQTRLSEAPTDLSSLQEVEPPRTEEEYVYDLYYCKDGDFDDLQMENMLSAHAVDESLFAEYLPQDDEEVPMDDEDDSNDENNWRNDYPDEDELSGFDEEDDTRLALKLKNISLGECPSEELSSDEEDEDLIYGGEEGRAHYWTVQDEDEDKDNEDEDEEYLDDIDNSSDSDENIHH